MHDAPAGLGVRRVREGGRGVATNNEILLQTAATAGLMGLNQAHLAQLKRAMESARELGDKLPKDLHYSEEIALTFRIPAAADSAP